MGSRIASETSPLRADDFVVRAYQPGDEAQILALFHRVFHAGRTLAHWRWKYLDSPFGATHISLVFAPDGELVAHYAGYIVPFVDRRESAPASLACMHIGDTMTHPAFRHIGRGPTSLLAKAVEHFYAHSSAGRVAFNYGFNTGNIQRFSLRFVRAQRLEDVTSWTLPAGARGLPASPVYETESVDELVDGEWDDLFERAADGYGVLVRRDARYVRWRYLDCPDRHHRLYAVRQRGLLVGWGVFRVVDNELVCGDVLFVPELAPAMSNLITHARSIAPRSAVTMWSSRRPEWWVGNLGNMGLQECVEPNQLALMVVPFLMPDPARDLLPGLFYTRGDGDLF